MKRIPVLLFLLWGLVAWLGAVVPVYAQDATGTISGRIVDGAGEGLPGVTILVQGTTKGAATVSDGSFTIRDVPAGSYTLTASSVGMTTARQQVTVTAGSDTPVNLSLKEDATQLSEAVVVGYGFFLSSVIKTNDIPRAKNNADMQSLSCSSPSPSPSSSSFRNDEQMSTRRVF